MAVSRPLADYLSEYGWVVIEGYNGDIHLICTFASPGRTVPAMTLPHNADHVILQVPHGGVQVPLVQFHSDADSHELDYEECIRRLIRRLT